jgi:hypothetical protein
LIVIVRRVVRVAMMVSVVRLVVLTVIGRFVRPAAMTVTVAPIHAQMRSADQTM